MRLILCTLALVVGGLSTNVSVAAPAPPTLPVLVAFTRAHNVYLMSGAGGRSAAITTRGGVSGIQYPAYSWSPDGKYLLLLRWHSNSSKGDLLLLNQRGKVLRTLAPSIPAPADFWPGWAIDADQIAFIAA